MKAKGGGTEEEELTELEEREPELQTSTEQQLRFLRVHRCICSRLGRWCAVDENEDEKTKSAGEKTRQRGREDARPQLTIASPLPEL